MEPSAAGLTDIAGPEQRLPVIFLLRVGEIALKGDNRSFFEARLRKNVRLLLRGIEHLVSGGNGRFLVRVPAGTEPEVRRRLSKVFGLVGFAKTQRVEKDEAEIEAAALQIVGELDDEARADTFKVEARRTDKSFPLRSYDIARRLGARVQRQFPTLRVDVHRPSWTLNVEIRERAYVFVESNRGAGGLPVGTGGRGMVLLSGGIDSPVAAYMMAKRGIKLDAVYFHAYPYTSDDARKKVETLATILAPYLCGVNLFVVPFTACQMRIAERAASEEMTLLMRACMMNIAARIALDRRAACLVTGESLSQVASQTLESITFTGESSPLPVFRPLIGLDKEEIIATARRIGTFETSILPFEDCCTIFSPRHPLIRPQIERMRRSLSGLEIEPLLAEAVDNAERFTPPF